MLAFSSKDRPIAYAEPTFSDGFYGANGQPVTRAVTVPLAGDFALDVRALLAAAPDAGLFYICNPNNPTGLVTRARTSNGCWPTSPPDRCC
jgi:histidinol-phosphate aminotransferase